MSAKNARIETNHIYDITYESATNKNHIEQYGRLLKKQYRKELNLKIEDITKVDLNPLQQTFIIRHGEKVIGGAKLIVSYDHNNLLPMESDNFLTTDLFPSGCNSLARADIGRLVLDQEYRGWELIYRIISVITQAAISKGCTHLFVLAPPLNAVLYRRVCTALGMPTKIRKDVDVPVKEEYRELGLRLLSCDIRKQEKI